MTAKREERRQRAEQSKDLKVRQQRQKVVRGRLLVAAAVLVVIALFYASTRQTAPPGKVWSPEHGHWHDR